MVFLLATLLVISAAYNFYVFLQVRKHRAALKYMEYEFRRFAADAEARIADHEGLIRDTRAELKTLEEGEGGSTATEGYAKGGVYSGAGAG